MENNGLDSQPVLILGGGGGGSALLELLDDEDLVSVVGIVDQQQDAPAFKLAKKLNIPIFTDIEEALNACKPCIVFNLTGDESVSDLAAEIVGPSSIIGGLETNLIWSMVNKAKEALATLEKNKLLTESIVTHAMEGIILIDSRGIIKAFNPAAETIFGYTHSVVIEKNISMLMPEPDQSAHDGYLKRYLTTGDAHVVGIEREVVAMHKSGRTFPISLSANEMVTGGEHFFVGIVSDISERKINEELIRKQAYFDPLTGLPNRTLFYDRIGKALAQAKRQKQKLAVLFLDLDGFKAVNDTLGHVAGDLLLKEVAVRLLKSIREGDSVARFGGDEFAFILCNIKNQENVASIAAKMIKLISEPYLLDGKQCNNIGGSIGVAMYPDDHVEVDTLINQADTAMYAVKKTGKNHCRFYEESMEPF